MKAKALSKNLNHTSDNFYLREVLLHVGLGFLIFFLRPLSYAYTLGILIFFVIKILKNPKNPFVILQAASYVMAAEVFLRMTGGLLLYETGKYAVIFFVLIGIYFNNFQKSAYIYVIFIILLLPSIFITYFELNYDTNFRKTLLFNLSGPLCLFASAIFCYKRQIRLTQYLRLLDTMVLPIIAMTTYLFLYTPNVQDVVTGAESNFVTSGGFGPNQVSTILGLGIFCLFVRLFLTYKNRFIKIIMYVILASICFRALITLSRGGVLTALVISIVFLIGFFRYATFRAKIKGISKVIFIVLGALLLWSVSIVATNNMIYNRYTGRNTGGVKEKSITTGRLEIAMLEIEAFKENPIFGIGIGMSKYYRARKNSELMASHNELTRLVSEHGSFGVFSIFLLIGIPVLVFVIDNRNIFMIPLILFWLLTISHSSMRIAAPGFIYGLALLKVNIKPSTSDE